jgi:hypothetical protein
MQYRPQTDDHSLCIRYCEYLICFGPKNKVILFLGASPAEIEDELNTGASKFYTDGDGFLKYYAAYEDPPQTVEVRSNKFHSVCEGIVLY